MNMECDMNTNETTFKCHFIYLAAGFSRRFFGNKLLAAFRGKPLYRHGLDLLRTLTEADSTTYDLTVVTQYDEIVSYLKTEGITCVRNSDPSRGQSSSIQTGITYLVENGRLVDTDYLIFFTGDQPFLKADSLERYLQDIRTKRPLLAAYACEGKMRNPGAFKACLKDEFFSLTGEMGGRGIFQAHKEDIMAFTAFEAAELSDIDDRDDLARAENQGMSVV